MSKVVIAGNASGTGVYTLEAPNGNTDRTLVLPDEAGTIITTAGVPASAMPAGSVIQVVHGQLFSDRVYVSSSVFVNVGNGVAITPISASSKILVSIMVSVNIPHEFSVGRNGNSNLSGITHGLFTQSGSIWQTESFFYVDSPATTSTQTYYLTARGYNGSTTTVNFGDYAANGPFGYMTLMEIAQ